MLTRPMVHTDLDECFDLDLALAITAEPAQNSAPGVAAEAVPDLDALVARIPTVLTADACAVCMEKIDGARGGGKRMPCSHVFHADCVSTWLSLRGSCPLCRRCFVS